MSSKIKIGIVGIGRIGWPMATGELKQYPDQYEIVAACDLLEERIQRMEKEFGCKTYLDYAEMLKQSDIELVYIATRSCDHYKHVMMALAAGKDVLVEKPATISYEQALDMFAHANKKGTPRLFVHQQRRFEGPFNAIKNVIESGKLGKVYEVNIEENGFQFRDDWQTISEFGGGQLLNWGPHIIDHSLQLLGTPTADVQSYVQQIVAGGDCEDHLRIRFVGDNNRVVNMCISGSKALMQGRRIEAFGDRGAAVFSSEDDCTIKLRYINPAQEVPEVISDPGTPGGSFGTTGTYKSVFNPEWITEEKKIEFDEKLITFWEYLYDSLRNGADFPVTEQDVLAIMRTISLVKAQNKKIMKMD